MKGFAFFAALVFFLSIFSVSAFSFTGRVIQGDVYDNIAFSNSIPRCQDSDNGYYSTIAGTVTTYRLRSGAYSVSATYVDTCTNTRTLKENYCVQGQRIVDSVRCVEKCLDGACTIQTTTTTSTTANTGTEQTTTSAIELIDNNAKVQINSLFNADNSKKTVVYLPDRSAVIWSGENFNIRFAIKNILAGVNGAQDFRYAVSAAEIESGCQLTQASANSFIIQGGSGSVRIAPGPDTVERTIVISVPEGSPQCVLNYRVDVTQAGTFYDSLYFLVTIVPRTTTTPSTTAPATTAGTTANEVPFFAAVVSTVLAALGISDVAERAALLRTAQLALSVNHTNITFVRVNVGRDSNGKKAPDCWIINDSSDIQCIGLLDNAPGIPSQEFCINATFNHYNKNNIGGSRNWKVVKSSVVQGSNGRASCANDASSNLISIFLASAGTAPIATTPPVATPTTTPPTGTTTGTATTTTTGTTTGTPVSISVIYPNGGETLYKTTDYYGTYKYYGDRIRWSGSRGRPDRISVFLVQGENRVLVRSLIFNSYYSEDNYPLQTLSYEGSLAGTEYRIRVCDNVANVCDESDGTFTISDLSSAPLPLSIDVNFGRDSNSAGQPDCWIINDSLGKTCTTLGNDAGTGKIPSQDFCANATRKYYNDNGVSGRSDWRIDGTFRVLTGNGKASCANDGTSDPLTFKLKSG